MISETRKKEITILNKLKEGVLDVCELKDAVGMSRTEYYMFVHQMKAKGIYPNIDLRVKRERVQEEIKKFPIDLIVRYLEAEKEEFTTIDFNRVYSVVREYDINKYVEHFTKKYKCNVVMGCKAIITECYDNFNNLGIPTLNILRIINNIKVKKLVKPEDLKKSIKEFLKDWNERKDREEEVKKEELRKKLEAEEELRLVESENKELGSEVILEETDRSEDNTEVERDLIEEETEFLRSLCLIKNDSEEKEEICDTSMFSEKILPLMSHELLDFYKRWQQEIITVDRDIVLGIEACYKSLVERGLPALEWFEDGFRIVVRKLSTNSITGKDKATGYFISMIRNWENYGKGCSGRWQDKLLFKKLEELSGVTITPEIAKKIYQLMGTRGHFAIYLALQEYGYIGDAGIDFYIDKLLPVYIEMLEKKYKEC